MAPIQQKFTVIPELPTGRSNGSNTPTGPPSKPPMTSKQAKKLYKAANKGPKLSKAEQRRQDLFEQDRIRKEFEKEKNQARAKASRDKRREKEEKEKAAKRKKGLPLVDVHPSQDTLARFVRPQPKPKLNPKDGPATSSVARQDDDCDFTLPAESDAEPPSKRRKTTSPNPQQEAQEAQKPSFVSYSRSANRQVASSPTPHPPPEIKIERPSKRQESSNSPHKGEAQWTQDQSLARYPGPAKRQRSGSPVQQEQVRRGLEPTKTDSYLPKNPGQHVVSPPRLNNQGQGQMDKPSDYDTDAAEILDLLAQQIANESFSAEDFLLIDGPAIQSRPEAPVSGSIAPRLAESTRPGHTRPKSTSERTRLGEPKANSQARRTPQQPLRGQPSGVADILDHNQVPSKKSIGGKVLTRSGAGTHPDTANRTGFRDQPVSNPLDTQSKPTHSAEKLTHSAANPSNPTWPPPRASAFSKPVSRAPLCDISLNHTSQMRAGNDEGPLIIERLNHTEAVSKTAQPVFRKPDLPRPASKSREPGTPSMGPPPGPPRFKTPAYQTSGLSGNRPKFLPEAPPLLDNRPAAANSPGDTSHTFHTPAPSSTQLFLSGLEDFFPSPSQELKEIFDDSGCTHRGAPANKKTWPPPSRPMPLPKTNITRASSATHKLRRKPLQRNSLCIAQSPVIPAVPACAPPAPKISANQSNQDDWFPPFSTQDFFFSTQDLREVEENIPLPGKSQLVPAKAGVKPTMMASFSSGDSTSEPPALPPCGGQPLARGSGTRLTCHKPETMVLVASDLCDSQDPWLNLSSQQSRGSLPETPTAVHFGAKVTSFNSAFEPSTTQQPGQTAPGGDSAPSERHIDSNASSTEGLGTVGSPPPKQPSLSSLCPTSPQKSLEALRPSPKPFFTSSGTKELTLLAIEKSKRTAREDEFARRRPKDEEIARQRFAQRRQEMEEAKREEGTRLAKEEEARLAREEAARLVLLERQDQRDPVARPSPQGRPTEDDQEGSELEDDGIDQLLLESALDGGLMSGGPAQNKRPPPGIFSTRKPTGNAGGLRSRSEGSFEKMMALAHKKVSRRGQDQAARNAAPAESAMEPQAAVIASQETDYGDAEWDECDLDGFL